MQQLKALKPVFLGSFKAYAFHAWGLYDGGIPHFYPCISCVAAGAAVLTNLARQARDDKKRTRASEARGEMRRRIRLHRSLQREGGRKEGGREKKRRKEIERRRQCERARTEKRRGQEEREREREREE